MAISSVKWVNDSLVISAFPDISISEVTDFRIKVGSCSRACDNKFRNSVVAESQTSCHGAQIGTGKGPERCFDLFSRVCFHGCNRAFGFIFSPSLFLYRPQQLFPRIGQAVLLQTALGFVGNGVFDQTCFAQIR